MTGAGDLLRAATTGAADPPLLPVPDRVAGILAELGCPPRLGAHLRLVHDVAHRITGWVQEHCPALEFDRDAVLFGAATHDIGKAAHVAELSGPGAAHERAGQALLLEHGVGPGLARFAATHASWTDPGTGTEDLLVSLADKAWKNARVPALEDLVVARLAQAGGRAVWEEFLALDDVLTRIGEGAGERLEFQASFPVHG